MFVRSIFLEKSSHNIRIMQDSAIYPALVIEVVQDGDIAILRLLFSSFNLLLLNISSEVVDFIFILVLSTFKLFSGFTSRPSHQNGDSRFINPFQRSPRRPKIHYRS